MKKAYLTLGFLAGLIVASLIFAMAKPSNEGDATQTKHMKVAHGLPTNHPVHAGIEHFADRVAFHSGGRLQFDVFPNGQLGSETQTLEQMQSGTLDMAKVGASTISSFIPVAQVFSLPYVFRSSDHYWAVLNGAVGEEMLDQMAINGAGQPSGFRGLTYFDAGSRNFYAQKPIMSPEDLVGLKVRVMNDPVAIDTMKALGASPTPISWGELYTALQQGVVDGAENNPPSFVSSRHFEVCKEFSFDHHSRVPDLLIVSSVAWDGLTEEEQGWIEAAAAEASDFQREAWAAGVNEAIVVMEEQQVQIYEPDMQPFIDATESVRSKYAVGEMQGILESIQNVAE